MSTPRRLAALALAAAVAFGCSTKTTNNHPSDATTVPAESTTTSQVGTKPGPAPGVITPTPAPGVSLETSFLHLDADDLGMRPPAGGPRPGATFPEVQVGSAGSASDYFANDAEQEFRQYTNDDRAKVGAPLVARDQYLDDYARAQALAMGQHGGIYHSNIGVLLCCYWTVGENVGVGPSARAIQYAYEASYGHFRNLTNETFSRMGIGVYVAANGWMWTASTFAG